MFAECLYVSRQSGRHLVPPSQLPELLACLSLFAVLPSPPPLCALSTLILLYAERRARHASTTPPRQGGEDHVSVGGAERACVHGDRADLRQHAC